MNEVMSPMSLANYTGLLISWPQEWGSSLRRWETHVHRSFRARNGQLFLKVGIELKVGNLKA